MPLLEVRDLTVEYTTQRGAMRAVDGVSFAVEAGQHLGLIGESGCGKSTLGRALLRVLPRNGSIAGGEIRLNDRDLVTISEEQMRRARWRELSMVPQSSMDALDPVYRVGDQIKEVLTNRGDYNRRAARERAVELFALVGLAKDRLSNYPHEFSGGMRQRAVIALALALEPDLVVADEPVTALDVIVQHQVLKTFRELQERFDLSVIMITHDISVVAETCDEVAVMYAGKIVEQTSVERFFHQPFHPYTLGLQNAYPSLHDANRVLISIDGYPPDLIDPPSGCRFRDRCPFAIERCQHEEPPLIEVAPGHRAACHRWPEVEKLRSLAKEAATWQKRP
ncbi:MAG: ABC transporter ATP-binding protein [Chloroflexia bacterium]|nr:ABC transporter ATP-binding protein [Chloroflexia bacterium]MDQ3412609.1 ABC transporter ATP-binding protein [Chloroflexota bacterium]